MALRLAVGRCGGGVCSSSSGTGTGYLGVHQFTAARACTHDRPQPPFTILSAPPASHNLFTPTVVAQPSPSITTGTQQAQAARRPADQEQGARLAQPFFSLFPFCERACANCPGYLCLCLCLCLLVQTQLINRSTSRHQRLLCHLFPSSPASASQPFSLPFPWSITAHPPLDCPPVKSLTAARR